MLCMSLLFVNPDRSSADCHIFLQRSPLLGFSDEIVDHVLYVRFEGYERVALSRSSQHDLVDKITAYRCKQMQTCLNALLFASVIFAISPCLNG